MVVRLVWSPEARRDLLDIYIVIGLENPAAAERLYDRIEAKAEGAVASPPAWAAPPRYSTARAGLGRGTLSHLLYETHPDTDDGPVDWVEIVRVVDGRRDLARVI